MEKTVVLARSKNATSETAAGEAIIIDMRSGTYFSLNEVGTLFWERLDGRSSLGELAAGIAREYEVAVEEVVSDLTDLAEQLVSEGLVDEVGPS